MKQIITGILALYIIVALSSCAKTVVYGCTDPTAYNYNANATQDNGSCIAKVYGCTDPTASNYSSYANVSDGSCTYNGQVNFWTAVNTYGQITVTIYGQTGYITSYYYSGTPTCGSTGCATFTLPVGTYTFYAYNGSGTTWNSSGTSTVTVNANSCFNEELY